jgi:predicted ABC-type ATPase
MRAPVYSIFAGINGSGKTALYGVLKDGIDIGERVSIDDIVKSMGDWRDPLLQIKGARMAMKRLGELIDEGETFHQETTLPGEAIVRFASNARDRGYTIVLYYVGVDSLDIAIDRVHRRVEAGGHGISDSIIIKRFGEMQACLCRLIPYCNEIYFYDNTKSFRQVAIVIEGETVDADTDIPIWMSKLKESGAIYF